MSYFSEYDDYYLILESRLNKRKITRKRFSKLFSQLVLWRIAYQVESLSNVYDSWNERDEDEWEDSWDDEEWDWDEYPDDEEDEDGDT